MSARTRGGLGADRGRALAGLRALALAALAIALEWTRVSVVAQAPTLSFWALLVGGAALAGAGLLGARRGWRDLGLGRDHLPERVLGGLALAVVLVLPAAVRWTDVPALGAPWAIAAIAVSVGEELAFRGALFVALEEVGGGGLAVAGSTAAWVIAHVPGHPPAFLPAVAAAGLLLGLWRWRFRGLVAPIVAHVLADLLL